MENSEKRFYITLFSTAFFILAAFGGVYTFYIEEKVIGKQVSEAIVSRMKDFNKNYFKILNKIGDEFQVKGDYEAARSLYEESLNLAKEFGNKYKIAESQYKLGNVYQVQGDYVKAKIFYEESEKKCTKRIMNSDDYEDIEDTNNILEFLKLKATALNSIGFIYHARGYYDKAETFHKKALDLREDLNDKPGMAEVNVNFGMIEQEKGNFDRAKTLYNNSTWGYLLD